MADLDEKKQDSLSQTEGDIGLGEVEIINASGHKQEVD